MGPRVKRITNSVKLGDNPYWDIQSQSLYFLDVYGQSVHRYYPALKKHTTVFIGADYVSMILPFRIKNSFIINTANTLLKIDWNEEKDCMTNPLKMFKLRNVPNDKEKFYLYCAKCDASGRIWAQMRQCSEKESSPQEDKCCLISLDNHKNIKMHWVRNGLCNGFTWSPDNTKFYYADSYNDAIEEYDFDIDSGVITKSSCKIVFTFKKYCINGYPSGITTDSEGNLWITIFNGYHVIKIDPTEPETLLETIPLPAKQLTNLVFGGPFLNKIYVTSGSLTIDEREYLPPYNGATYVISGTGATGIPSAHINKF